MVVSSPPVAAERIGTKRRIAVVAAVCLFLVFSGAAVPQQQNGVSPDARSRPAEATTAAPPYVFDDATDEPTTQLPGSNRKRHRGVSAAAEKPPRKRPLTPAPPYLMADTMGNVSSIYLDELPPLGSSPATTVAAVVRLALAVPDPVPPATFVPAPEGLALGQATAPLAAAKHRVMRELHERRGKRDFFAATLLGSAELNGAPPRVVFSAKGPGEPSWLAVVTGFSVSNRSNSRAKLFARIAIAGKALYCRRWAHDLYAFDLVGLVRASGLRGRSVLWGKTLAVAAALAGGHAWVAWHDADMIFTDFGFNYAGVIAVAEASPPPPPAFGEKRRAPDDDGSYDRASGDAVDFIVGNEEPVVRRMSINTGHYLLRNSKFAWLFMHDSFAVPHVKHDQDAWALMLGYPGKIPPRDERWQADRQRSTALCKQHTRIVQPLRVIGGWIATSSDRWLFGYDVAHAHFSGCDKHASLAVCARPATHLFATGIGVASIPIAADGAADVEVAIAEAPTRGLSLRALVELPPSWAFGGPMNSTVADDGQPLRPNSTVTRPHESTNTTRFAVVTFALNASAIDTTALAKFARAANATLYVIGPDDYAVQSSDVPPHPAKRGLRALEAVLPLHEWALFVDADVSVGERVSTIPDSIDLAAVADAVPPSIALVVNPAMTGCAAQRQRMETVLRWADSFAAASPNAPQVANRRRVPPPLDQETTGVAFAGRRYAPPLLVKNTRRAREAFSDMRVVLARRSLQALHALRLLTHEIWWHTPEQSLVRLALYGEGGFSRWPPPLPSSAATPPPTTNNASFSAVNSSAVNHTTAAVPVPTAANRTTSSGRSSLPGQRWRSKRSLPVAPTELLTSVVVTADRIPALADVLGPRSHLFLEPADRVSSGGSACPARLEANPPPPPPGS